MKKLSLLLPGLLAMTACTHRVPEVDPLKDIPQGLTVQVTLQDWKNPRMISTWLIDPRAGRVLGRLDGQAALEHLPLAASARSALPFASSSGDAAAAQGSPAQPSKSTHVLIKADCDKGNAEKEEDCAGASFPSVRIDPPPDKGPNPSPTGIPDLSKKARIAATQKFVTRIAQSTAQAIAQSGLAEYNVRVERPGSVIQK